MNFRTKETSDTTDNKSVSATKRRYQKPELKHFGAVTDMTQTTEFAFQSQQQDDRPTDI